jgi:adenosylcobinamide kinase / adenosylcobinamide-phosphate guanylyltransferase
MGRLTLVTGGAASGKSCHALRLASQYGERILFVATCDPRDDEMRDKVARHQAQRPASWTTVESTRRLADAFQADFDGAVVDCLTLLVSQLLIDGVADAEILGEIRGLCATARQVPYPTVLVTNEVGQGVVPEHPLGRRFRELAGRSNQLAASMADDVELLVCGIPMRIKHAG